MKQLNDLLQKKRDNLAEIRNRMTDVIFPSKSEIDQIRATYSKGLPPGTNLIIYNAKMRQYSHAKSNNQIFISPKSMLQVHPRQALIKKLNDTNLEILLCNYFQSNSIDEKIYCRSSCSLSLRGEEYKSYYIISKALSYDENNYPIQYLKWYVPISKYWANSFISFFDFKSKQRKNSDIQEELRQFNLETLNAIGFTKRQLQVMNLYAQGVSSTGVAEKLSLSRRTIEKHNQQILYNAKFLFNHIRRAVDVAHLLDDQGIFNYPDTNT